MSHETVAVAAGPEHSTGVANRPHGEQVYLARAIEEMKSVFKDIPYGIDHSCRVLSNAKIIMNGEAITGVAAETVCLAAVFHDIGAVEAHKKHGSMEGRWQEIEGPPVAQPILARMGVPEETINRVCYIVGSHHTPAKIDGIDFQIIWEADYLECLHFGEKRQDPDTLRQKILENFKTVTGRNLAYERLGIVAPGQ